MVITNISVQKKDKGRFSIEVDNEFFCGVSSTTIAQFNIYKGKEVSEDLLKEIIDTEIENRFFDRAVGFATNSLKTQKQVENYLKQLSFKKKGLWFKEDLDISNVFPKVIDRIKKYNIINDYNFAKAFIESRLKNKPRGKKVIIQELIVKGIDEKLAKEVANELIIDEVEAVKICFEKRFRTQKFDKQNRKQVDFLLRKGFDWDDICKLENQNKY